MPGYFRIVVSEHCTVHAGKIVLPHTFKEPTTRSLQNREINTTP